MISKINISTITDNDFDILYPEQIKNLSSIHWSPAAAIKTAVDFFTAALNPSAKILDIGSGVGKFCILASLMSEFQFIGVEKRKSLFQLSNLTSAKLGTKNVSFVCKDALNLDWNDYDGLYIFNPFYEFKMSNDSGFHIDNEVTQSETKYNFYVEKTHKKLRLLKSGTVVVTLHGYGKTFPSSYCERFYKKIEGLEISLWEKNK